MAGEGEGQASVDFDAEQRGLRIAAIREVFEEAGILLASHTDGSPMGDQIAPMNVRQIMQLITALEGLTVK